MLIKVVEGSNIPVYRQIVVQLKALIDQGVIEVNKPLPSTRSLSKKMGINRGTIDRAYKELQAFGYLSSRPGSYHVVLNRKTEAVYSPDRKSDIPWQEASNLESNELFMDNKKRSIGGVPASMAVDSALVDLSKHQLDPRLLPIQDLKRCVNHILTKYGAKALDFCPAAGNDDLREYIAQRMRLHGISTCKDEILITNGSQEALSLLCQFLVRPGRKIVGESPTYFSVLTLLKFAKADLVGVPMNGEGMDLDHLERVLGKESVSFIYTIPNFQNPTGITTSHHHRERLLGLAVKYKVPIVEDGFEEEMKYYGKVPLPIKSIDERNVVIYVGTFTKSLFPGIRIGWINADKECIDRLTAIKQCTHLRCSNFSQMVLWYFCKEGYYDLHIRKLHRVFRKRMDTAHSIMQKSFPEKVSWSRPAGGYNFWVRMPKKLTPRQLCNYMAGHGVIVTPGAYFFLDQTESEYFRISLARINDDEIKEGLARLGKALRQLSVEI